MIITPKDNAKDFGKFMYDIVDIYLYKHKYLNDYIEKSKSGEVKFYDASVISTSEGSWILILHSDVLLIYGENWKISQFEEIQKVVDLRKFKNYLLMGNSELIYALIKFFDIKVFSIEKERIYYRSKKIVDFKNNKLKIEHGSQDDLNELAVMLQQYYHEEYKGLNDKTIIEMQQRIFQVLLTRSIYVLRNHNNNILSFCTIIDPDVGILFTKKEHRKMGFGKLLLSFCSKLLLKKNSEVYVMTDKDEIASNKACVSVGFNPYFNYSMIEINCG
jgi:hypothetical protein